ncbi:opioid growth factor receptor-related protein [Methanosarcina sp. MTP4]|uniref:opioid growth factor receptor-related protein n=1 Tax=Methanosarcina sp. MTP4 TaxID=1434100 RepID=UPI00064E9D2A|nr:opioid growth factor receptor-related protein [Methanosarcina sp. MTP4]
MQYVEHLENKFDGEIGVLEKRHIQVDCLVYIGKEANNIENQPLDVRQVQVFVNEEEVMRKVLKIHRKKQRFLGC